MIAAEEVDRSPPLPSCPEVRAAGFFSPSAGTLPRGAGGMDLVMAVPG